MSSLATRLELEKLATLLEIDPQQLQPLQDYQSDELRQLRRLAISARNARVQPFFAAIARFINLIPVALAARLAPRMGPLLTAKGAVEMPSLRAAQLAARLPADFLADICLHLDPQRSRELVRHLDQHTLVSAALRLVAREAFMPLGQMADFLDDDAIQAVMDAIEDDCALLRIAFYMESRTRLDHLVRLMPAERRENTVLTAADPANNLVVEMVALLANVGYTLRRELGELAVAQPWAVLEQIILVSDAEQLWPELLPVMTALSTESKKKILALPLLRRQPALLSHAISAADQHQLWSSVLPLISLMDEGLLDTVAEQAALLPDDAIERAMTAALLTEQWTALALVAKRLPADRQAHILKIIDHYGEVDPELRTRLLALAEENGIKADQAVSR